MKRWLTWIVLGVIFCFVPLLSGDYVIYVVSLTFVHIIVCIGLNITLGYSGQISLCQASFFGIGAYTAALLLKMGWSFWLLLPLSGLIAAAFGIIIGFPALKWKDHYLALITLAFNIVTFLVMQQEGWLTGGPTGISGIPRPSLGPLKFSSDVSYFYFLLFFAALALVASYWIVQSKWGRAFRGIRENELAAEAHGVNLRNYKLLAFGLGAFFVI